MPQPPTPRPASTVDRGEDKPASAGWQQACDITAAADFDRCHEKIARTMDMGSRSHEIDRAGARIVPMVS